MYTHDTKSQMSRTAMRDLRGWSLPSIGIPFERGSLCVISKYVTSRFVDCITYSVQQSTEPQASLHTAPRCVSHIMYKLFNGKPPNVITI